MAMFSWNPVKREASLLVDNQGTLVTEPPCKNCKYWNPQPILRNTPEGIITTGLVMCHNEDMNFDFSCFKDKKEAENGARIMPKKQKARDWPDGNIE